MRFSCKYDVLLSNLQDITNVVEDTLANDDDKNAIFKFSRECVKLIGISPVITFRLELQPSDYQLDLNDSDLDANGVMYMQLKSKELLAFLNSYKSVRKTNVDEVIFEPERNKIKCTVIESPRLTSDEINAIEEELMYNPNAHDIRLDRYSSHWMFDSLPIKPNRLGSINLPAPDAELVQIQSQLMTMYTSALLPLMENTTSLWGYLEFDKGHVVAFNKTFTTIMANLMQGEVFDGLKLSYRALTFIEKILGRSEEFGVFKTERHLYFKTELSEAFVLYDTRLAPYDTQLKIFTKEKFIRVDRIYLKDVLKRLSLTNDSIEVVINSEANTLTLSNSKFSQEINLSGQSGLDELPMIRFKIMPDVLNKAIIGSDDTFVNEENSDSADTFLYYCQHQNISAVAFSDITAAWFSLIHIKTY